MRKANGMHDNESIVGKYRLTTWCDINSFCFRMVGILISTLHMDKLAIASPRCYKDLLPLCRLDADLLLALCSSSSGQTILGLINICANETRPLKYLYVKYWAKDFLYTIISERTMDCNKRYPKFNAN